MTTKQQALGLFGGTFDPIHRGHIRIAEALIDALELQGMQFIPNNHPMYRDEPVASAEDRLAMVKIATAKNSRFSVNDTEIQRPGPTYTIDTILNIRQTIPEQPICLILGRDVFAKMVTWHDWETIPDQVHLVIINRPETQLPMEPWMKNLLKLHEISDAKLLQSMPGGYILQHEIEPLRISATEIRDKLTRGEAVSNQVDPDVLQYIQQHHLYR